jgi:hypothetical protein
MPDRPSSLWKGLPSDVRIKAAAAFWRDEDSPEIEMQQVEAALLIARRLNFRPKSVAALSVDRRARALAQIPDVSEAVATRALVAYHFTEQRPLMSAFLDALGIAHEDGLITAEQVDPPPADRIREAVKSVTGSFPAAEVGLYLKTLEALDQVTWANLEGAIPATA